MPAAVASSFEHSRDSIGERQTALEISNYGSAGQGPRFPDTSELRDDRRHVEGRRSPQTALQCVTGCGIQCLSS